jgi:hypothetical protein
MHPNWRRRNGSSNFLDDVAIVAFAGPVSGVPFVTLGGADVREATILGRGRRYAPGSGHSEASSLDGTLRGSPLKTISDRACARRFKGVRISTLERFDARMRCSIDADGRKPLYSGCFGDSGGPLWTGSPAAPVQLGVVSWGGDKCGADHSPSVFADVNRYRAFITDPTPTWGPTQHTTVKVSGSKTRTCTAAEREPGTKLNYTWKRNRQLDMVGHGRHYKTTKSDAGHRLYCFVNASNDGGEILAGTASVMVAR